MSKKIVKRKVDLAALPELGAVQKAEVLALQGREDKDIDYSDQAPLGDAFWVQAVRNPLYKPTKTSTTVRIDSDVLSWLRSQGKGYQSRINAILRKEMLASIK